MADKSSADIEKSAVYKMIKESESSGKSEVPLCPVPEYSQKQGLSFLLLQTLYDNEAEAAQRETNNECKISIYIPYLYTLFCLPFFSIVT